MKFAAGLFAFYVMGIFIIFTFGTVMCTVTIDGKKHVIGVSGAVGAEGEK